MIQVEKQIVIFRTVGHLLTVQPRDLGRQFGLIQRRLVANRSSTTVPAMSALVGSGSLLIRDAFAVRERRSDPQVVPGFRCPFRPDMPPSLTPGSSIVVSVQNTDVDIGLRHGPKGSALPIFPQSVSRGARFRGYSGSRRYGLSGCSPPVRT